MIKSLLSKLGLFDDLEKKYLPNEPANLQTINALIDAGSDPKKEHPLEHHFYCFSEESLGQLLNSGKSIGYQPANVGTDEHEGQSYWYGDLIKNCTLDLGAVNRENSIMLKIAAEFGADYDGWGTPVVS